MLRKMTFALAAVAALGTAMLASTAVSAHGSGGHGFGGHGFGGHGFGRGWGWGGVVVDDGCLRPVVVNTPAGPATRLVNVCY